VLELPTVPCDSDGFSEVIAMPELISARRSTALPLNLSVIRFFSETKPL
jgi:hypothetical protein